jgi:ATP-dependent Lon protease
MSNSMPEPNTVLRGGAPVPVSPFPMLLLRSGSLLPGGASTFSVARRRSVALVSAVHVGDVIAVVSQRDPKHEEPGIDDVHWFGTFARVTNLVRVGEGTFRMGLEGLGRFHLEAIDASQRYFRGYGQLIEETDLDPKKSHLLAEALHQRLAELAKSGFSTGTLPELDDEPGLFADRVASGLDLDAEQAAGLLALGDASARLSRVIELLGEITTTAELRQKIARDVKEQFGKHQRETILREQIKAMQKELGDDDAQEDDTLREKLGELQLPDDARKVVERELKRLKQSQGPEANVIRTYLEWIAALPWTARAEVKNDIDAIAAKLDADHSGLEDVKKRVLEHMAVHKLSGNPRGTILALVGPPGVGKTSLGQSIADATGRPLVRISLGGVRDEAEIRGHRRTYVGAIPGRIVHALRKAEVKNPIVLLDEIDKLARGFGGWPEAALLEVLDPEQNKSFTDHYLELPFDLSEVMFIATANTLDTLTPPLRDRLEIVELSGYTENEKKEIARRHLIPKRTRESGVPEGVLSITDAALSTLISEYTREAGVRQLDRELMRVTRKAALEVARQADDAPLRINVDASDVPEYLGKARFRNDVAERTAFPGVATGLAWTPVGGDILFIETTRMPGKGKLEITGQLGDVMKESARAALSYVRSHSAELGIDPGVLDQSDLHLHVPAGAVPKDGPSAGVTIFTALASLLSGHRVRPDTAMTGEVTLRGKVLPVGGIKAKVLAAHRAGITRVILPSKNERDLDDVPESVKDDLEVIFAADMSEVLAAALEDSAAPLGSSGDSVLGPIDAGVS